ncbi:MAG TPA: DUF3606 domain-containing protein [Saprospiraceae bacterium]|nr:DUF3606 domain-containing protein [Saprospiraceae bacterium]
MDSLRIDKNDPSEVAFVAQLFKCSTHEVLLAIQKAGTDMRKEIYAILENKKS